MNETWDIIPEGTKVLYKGEERLVIVPNDCAEDKMLCLDGYQWVCEDDVEVLGWIPLGA